MKLIVGLGNPGEKYVKTRHNVGFTFIEELRLALGLEEFMGNSKFNADIARSDSVTLIKPLTFMNQSGQAVLAVSKFYKILPEDIYVIHDDLDIPLGSYKMQKGVSPKKHNGVNSVNESLGTVDYWRVRIGVDNRVPDRRIGGEEYVLQKFAPGEENIIKELTPRVITLIKSKLEDGK